MILAVTLLAVLGAAIAALCAWLKYRHSYWRSRKVPGPAPSIPFGNCMASCLGRRAVYEDFADLYRKHHHEPYVGIYYIHTPLLMLNDLDTIRQVFVKEFHDFNGRGMFSDPEQDHLSGHLFILSGQPWRNMRVKLSPTFTSGKIKYFFGRVQECAMNMQRHVDAMVSAGGGSYQENVRELVARYATDIIASLILGVDSNTMSEPDSELRRIGKLAFAPSFSQGMRFNMLFFARDVMKKFNISIQNPAVNEFFNRIVGDTIKYREQNGVERADLLNLLIQLKNKGFIPPDSVVDGDGTEKKEEDNLQKLTLGQVVAQVFVFYIAGFETTSTTTSFSLYELAKNPEALVKATEEVDRVMQKHNGEITYEAVNSVPYLEKVINETLRLYPPVPFLTREVMKRRFLPNTDLMLEKGTTLVIPVNAIQRDPELWENPDVFDPERFSEEKKANIHPMSYLPFGDGPRICIGMRLGMVQVKTALMALLHRFSVSRNSNTPNTIEVEPWSIVPAPRRGLPITLSKRTLT